MFKGGLVEETLMFDSQHKVEKILKGSVDSIPYHHYISENSNYGRESLLEV